MQIFKNPSWQSKGVFVFVNMSSCLGSFLPDSSEFKCTISKTFGGQGMLWNLTVCFSTKSLQKQIYLTRKDFLQYPPAFKSSQVRAYFFIKWRQFCFACRPPINPYRLNCQQIPSKTACPLYTPEHSLGLVELLNHRTTKSGHVDLEDIKDQSLTHPFLVLQAVQHRFPPRVLLWTSLCSCLHLPISDWVLRLFQS